MDYAKNYTDILGMRYMSNRMRHWVYLRTGASGNYEYAAAQAALWATSIKPFVVAYGPTDFNWLEASFQMANTDTTDAIPLPTVGVGWAGSNAPKWADAANQTRWEARGSGGSRYSFSIFGLAPAGGTDEESTFRILESENILLADAISDIQLVSGLTAIDGTPLTWKRYVNFGQNARLKRKIRNR